MCFVFVLIYVILWFLVHFFSELSKFELIITTSELKYEPNSQKKIFIVNAVLSASTYHHLGWHLGHDHQNIEIPFCVSLYANCTKRSYYG